MLEVKKQDIQEISVGIIGNNELIDNIQETESIPAIVEGSRYLNRNVGSVIETGNENTAMILEMRDIQNACKAPVYDIKLDHDFDENAWSKLKSFLYYCK